MIDRNNPMPLYIQLKEELIKSIIEGKWEVNSQIPTEQELMKTYGVGRATVREAISLLVNQGYLCKNQGIGTFVIRNKPSLGFEPLISLSFTLKTKGLKGDNIVLDKHLFLAREEILKKLKWNNEKNCLYIRRLRSVETVPIAIETSYFSEEFNDSRLDKKYLESITDIIIKDLKVKISKFEQTFILRPSTKEEQELLKISEESQVLFMERWIYAENKEEPFYYLNFIVPENLYFLPLQSF